MRNQLKLAMILGFVAITLLCPASLNSAGSGSALSAQPDDILGFLPAIIAKPAPVLQKPVVNGTLVTLTWTYRWPDRTLTNPGYSMGTADSPTGFTSSTEGEVVLGRQSPASITWQYGLPGTHTYYYRVRAVYALSYGSKYIYSPYSNVVSATVTVPPSVTKTTVVASINNMLEGSNIDSRQDTVYQYPNHLGVGLNWAYGPVSGQTYIDNRTVLFFNIQSLISGKTINRAILRLYPVELAQNFNTTYTLQALAQTWSASTITWNNQPNVYTYIAKSVNPPTTLASPLEIDVTDMVQLWANGSWSNYGFVMYDSNWAFPYATLFRATWFESITSTTADRKPQLYLEYQ